MGEVLALPPRGTIVPAFSQFHLIHILLMVLLRVDNVLSILLPILCPLGLTLVIETPGL